jgi:hypothetical protein
MTNQKKCKAYSDCQRPANTETGRCDLHDAISMAADAMDLLEKNAREPCPDRAKGSGAGCCRWICHRPEGSSCCVWRKYQALDGGRP